MKKPTVTIGIPAYRESINLNRLLPALLSQNQKLFSLKEIIVVSDGKDQATREVVKRLGSPIIKLLENKTRLGQQLSQNRIIKEFKGDVLVIIEADTHPSSPDTLNLLLVPYTQKNLELGMVVGKSVSLPAKTFFEKVMNHAQLIKQGIFSEWKDGLNFFTANGHSMKALSRNFAKKIKWPTDVPEDTYTYLRLRELGLGMKRVKTAQALMRNVTNFNDRIRQCTKYHTGKKALTKYFPPETMAVETQIPLEIILKHTLSKLVTNPFWTLIYLIEAVINRIFTSWQSGFNPLYEIYYSSKILDINN